MTTYPAADGAIPTMQWEQFREGIDDVRYLTTLYAKLDEIRATHPNEVAAIEAGVEADLEKYKEPENIYSLTGSDFTNTRKLVVSKILEIDEYISPTPVPKPGDTDSDGDVDIFDYSTLITQFGSTGTNLSADFDGNGKVDIFDYSTLISNFGR